MVLSVKWRSIVLIFWIRNIIEFGHGWFLLRVGFVIYWLVNFIAVGIVIERIDLFPVKPQNIAWWFLVLFFFLPRTISYQVIDRLCHPWTGILLLLLFNKHSFEKLQIPQLVNCYSLLLFDFKTFQNHFFYFAW